MNILVINCGSSSIKYQLISMEDEVVLASGLVERIGEAGSVLKHQAHAGTAGGDAIVRNESIPDHQRGVELVVEILIDAELGVIAHATDIAAVGHRVVHGGEEFHAPTLVDDAVNAAIEACIPLAPLHNPPNLTGIRVAQKLLGNVPQVAVFDTAFFQTMESEAYLYGFPYEYYEDLRVRRYGFHGTSHKYVAGEAAKLLGKPLADCNLITAHLGNGCSMAAIKNGKAMDTSLGMTPLSGLLMGTRTGDFDPAIVAYLAEHKGMSATEIIDICNKQSGLKGVCGVNDLRDVHELVHAGDQRARLALDMFCYRIKKYIGSYYAAISHVDAIVFTAGIGENDARVRAQVLDGLEPLGIGIDSEKNAQKASGMVDISAQSASIKTFIIPTNEELEIALQTQDVLEKR